MNDTRSLGKTIAFYIFGTALTLVGVFAVIELATRTISWARGDGFSLALHEHDATDRAITDIYEFHPFTGFTFKPRIKLIGGHPGQEESAEILTDEHGFLSATGSLPLAKAPNEIRIATIGASTTANLNLTYEQNWPGRLGALIAEDLPDKEITVINAGIPGFDTAQSIANLALRVMPFKPDLVIIYHAYNDLKVVRPELALKPDYSNVHNRPFGQHEKPGLLVSALNQSMFYVRTRNSYRDLKRISAQVEIVKGSNRLDRVPDAAATIFEHNVRMLVASARAGGAQVILSSFATLHDPHLNYDSVSSETLTNLQKQELFSIMQYTSGLSLNGIFDGINRYNRILRELASEYATGWVDNAALIEHIDENFVDRVHFSAFGAERMAQNFYPAALEGITGRDHFSGKVAWPSAVTKSSSISH